MDADIAALPAPPTHPPRSRRRALLQFSLRELLMLIVIAALAAALWRPAPQSVEPTPFFATFDLDRLLKEMQRPEDALQPTGVRSTWSRATVLGPPDAEYIAIRRAYHSRSFDVRLAPQGILADMKARVESRLLANRCEVLDDGTDLLPGLPGFFLHYRHGATRGVVNFDCTETGNELRIDVLIHEFRAP